MKLYYDIARSCGGELHLEYQGADINVDDSTAREVNDFLQHIMKQEYQHGQDSIIEWLYSTVNTMLKWSQFRAVEEILSSTDVESTPTVVLIALLSLTLAAKHRIEMDYREVFYQKVERHLKQIEPKRYKDLLRGLE